MPPKWGSLMRAQIINLEEITEDLRRVWLQLERPLQDFIPGRFCMLTHEQGVKEKAYSIVSLTQGGHLAELFVELTPPQYQQETSFTPHLWQMHMGSSVFMGQNALGHFTLDESVRNHIMVATVTGIAPYMAILRTRLIRPADPNRFFVFWAGSFQNELAYHEELCELSERYPERLQYIAGVSQSGPHAPQNASWTFDFHNHRWLERVNHTVDHYLPWSEDTLGQGVTPQTSRLYACGHEGMVRDMKKKFAFKKDGGPLQVWPFKQEIF